MPTKHGWIFLASHSLVFNWCNVLGTFCPFFGIKPKTSWPCKKESRRVSVFNVVIFAMQDLDI